MSYSRPLYVTSSGGGGGGGGSQGPQGIQGNTGPTGPTGEQGPIGNAGGLNLYFNYTDNSNPPVNGYRSLGILTHVDPSTNSVSVNANSSNNTSNNFLGPPITNVTAIPPGPFNVYLYASSTSTCYIQVVGWITDLNGNNLIQLFDNYTDIFNNNTTTLHVINGLITTNNLVNSSNRIKIQLILHNTDIVNSNTITLTYQTPNFYSYVSTTFPLLGPTGFTGTTGCTGCTGPQGFSYWNYTTTNQPGIYYSANKVAIGSSTIPSGALELTVTGGANPDFLLVGSGSYVQPSNTVFDVSGNSSFRGGITGRTGSFTYLSATDISANRLDVYDLSVNHLATIGTSTTNLSSQYITTTGTITAGGLITASQGITGPTASFSYLSASQGIYIPDATIFFQITKTNYTAKTFNDHRLHTLSMSSTGQYQIAISTNNYIMNSSNYGNIWTTLNSTDPSNIIMVSISGNGQYMVAAGEYLYISNNYGQSGSWTTTSLGSQYFNYVAISYTGQYVACVYGNYVYVNDNYGQGNTWLQSTLSQVEISNLLMSNSGNFMIATNGSGNPNVISTSDFGQSWTSYSFRSGYQGPSAMSSTGQYVTYCSIGYINVSSNYGNGSWTSFFTGYNDLCAVAMTSSGEIIVASSLYNGLWISYDYGVSFKLIPSTLKFTSIAISSTGRYSTFISYINNYIYISNNNITSGQLQIGDNFIYGYNDNLIISSQNTTNFVSEESKFYGNIIGLTGSFTYLTASQGITGATGSFSYLSASQGITGSTGSFTYLAANRLDVYDLSVNHLATIGTSTTNLSSQYITTTGTITAGGLITASQGITGPTASFSYLSASQGITGSNLYITGTTTLSGTATAPTVAAVDNSTNIATTAFVQTLLSGVTGITGATGNSYWNYTTVNQPGIYYSTDKVAIGTNIIPSNASSLTVTGGINTDFLSASQGITGPTGSFSYLSASQGITGTTGSFSYLSASQGITGPTGSFSYLSASQGITGPTGSFSYLTSDFLQCFSTGTCPTPSTGDNSTNIATTAFVQNTISSIPATIYNLSIPSDASVNNFIISLVASSSLTNQANILITGRISFSAWDTPNSQALISTIDFNSSVLASNSLNDISGNIIANFNTSTSGFASSFNSSAATIVYNYSTSNIALTFPLTSQFVGDGINLSPACLTGFSITNYSGLTYTPTFSYS